MIRVAHVEVTGPQRLRIWFTDGSVGERDFADELSHGGNMARPLLEPAFFAREGLLRRTEPV